MSALTVALAHYRRRKAAVSALDRHAASMWRQVDPADMAGSWVAMLPRLLLVMEAAQTAEAAGAQEYVAAATAAQGASVAAVGRLNPAAFVGASDGRQLDTLLAQPVIVTKVALSIGKPTQVALAAGRASLGMIVGTQLADAGRTADQVALVAARQAGYVRMVVGKTCSRCIVLAGRWYRWNQGFRRHPRCDCVHIPAREDRADDVRTDPAAIFRAMSRDEQDKVFTRDGAAAVRDGADISQVVNARRGMYTAGGRDLTRESAGRGFVRLMPEQIYRQAGGNRDEAIRLLRQHRYIL